MCDGDGGGDGGKYTNTAGLTSQLSSVLAVVLCTPHHTTPHHTNTTQHLHSTMVVLDDKHNPDVEEEECSVVDSLTEEEMMTERSELCR